MRARKRRRCRSGTCCVTGGAIRWNVVRKHRVGTEAYVPWIVLVGRSVIQRSAFNARGRRKKEEARERYHETISREPHRIHLRVAARDARRRGGSTPCRRSRFLEELFITSQMVESARLVLGLKVSRGPKKLLFLRIYVSRLRASAVFGKARLCCFAGIFNRGEPEERRQPCSTTG